MTSLRLPAGNSITIMGDKPLTIHAVPAPQEPDTTHGITLADLKRKVHVVDVDRKTGRVELRLDGEAGTVFVNRGDSFSLIYPSLTQA